MRQGLLFIVGLALAGISGPLATANANLVTNGNFGSGDLTGWSVSDSTIFVDSGIPPASDAFDAQFTGDGILSQSIPTTTGDAYTLSFSLLDEAGFVGDLFTVNFGGFSTTILGSTAASDYVPEVFAIPGSDVTGASTTLSFQAINPSLAWNLDDVSVVTAAIPEAPTGAILGGAVLMILSLRLCGRMSKGYTNVP